MNFEEEKIRIANLPYTLRSDKLIELLDGFKRAIHEKNTSGVFIIDGRSGMGKSTLAMQIAKYCDKDFDLHKVHYEPQTFLEGAEGKKGLSQAEKGDVILFDEAMLISNRATLSYINRMVVQAMSMIRSKNIIVIFCVNSIFDLDKNIAISRADLLLHVYGESLTDRGRFCAFFRGQSGEDRIKKLYLLGKKFYDYSNPRANFIDRFGKHFAVNEQEYERQKQIGVNNFLNSMGGTQVKTKKDVWFNNLVKWVYENKALTQEEIANIIGCTRETVNHIIARTRS